MTEGPASLLAGDGACVTDGGTHGCVGHTLHVTAGGTATWERRLDSMGDPGECSGSGAAALDGPELAEWTSLVDAVWDAASRPATPPEGEMFMDAPPYEWAVAVRRGDEVRRLEGPPFGYPWQEPPSEVGRLLEWVRARVAAWCDEERGS